MIKMRYLTILTLGIIMLLISGCATPVKPVTKGEKFPKMYEQQPRSLLILPPMNESTDAEAKDYYMTTVEIPFASMGYYVMPVEMVSDIMRQEGITSTELLYNLPLEKLHEYFGADAVLYTHIKKWDVSYIVIDSHLTVSIESEIVSTKTSEKLWGYTGTVVQKLSPDNNSNNGLIGLLVNVIATAVATARADYVPYASIANWKLVRPLPFGPYHPLNQKDQHFEFYDISKPKDN